MKFYKVAMLAQRQHVGVEIAGPGFESQRFRNITFSLSSAIILFGWLKQRIPAMVGFLMSYSKIQFFKFYFTGCLEPNRNEI